MAPRCPVDWGTACPPTEGLSPILNRFMIGLPWNEPRPTDHFSRTRMLSCNRLCASTEDDAILTPVATKIEINCFSHRMLCLLLPNYDVGLTGLIAELLTFQV